MCGLFGVYYYGDNSTTNLEKLVAALGRASAVRGTDATGIAYPLDDHKIMVDKQGISAYQFKFNVPKGVKVVMGHTRAATKGKAAVNYNNHPFLGYTGKTRTPFALAHNGVLDNDDELRQSLPKSVIETDSYVAVQLLEQYGKVNMKTVKKMAETVIGSFVFTILDNKQNLFIVKNDNPIAIVNFKNLDMYVYASTQDILLEALFEYSPTKSILTSLLQGKGDIKKELEWITLAEGEILKISPNGKVTNDVFTPQERVRHYNWAYYYYGYDYDDITKKSSKKDDKKRDVIVVNTKENKEVTTTLPTSQVDILDTLYARAESLGHTAGDVNFLLDVGYSEEELLYAIEIGTFSQIVYDEYMSWGEEYKKYYDEDYICRYTE